jgi:DNA-binding transcriptional LysR family regulator
MDVRHLEIFLEVARRLNFTRAAAALHIAQPAVSQAIARLEGELGVTLFDRTGREVRLTDAGLRLLPHAERILGDVAAAERDIARLRGRALGRISVGVTPTVATHLLPRALAAFRAEHADVEVVLREGGTGALVTMIERGAVDLAIVVLPTERPGIDEVPLLTEPLLLAVAAMSPIARLAAQHGPIALRVAAEEPFILYRASYHLRSATIQGCRAAGFEPRVALEGGEMETVLRMVAAGLGVSLVPLLAFEGSPRPGVVGLSVSDPPLARTLGVAHRRDRPLSPAAEAFVATLGEAIGAEGASRS